MKNRTFGLMLLCWVSLSADLNDDAAAMVRQWFPNAMHTHKFWTIPDSLSRDIAQKTGKKFLRKGISIWAIDSAQTTIAYVIMDNAMGKLQPITFLAAISVHGTILHCKVLKYREAYGGQVQQPRWLAQFQGRSSGSGWKIGQDVDGISGATISVKSMTSALQRVSLLVPAFTHSKP